MNIKIQNFVYYTKFGIFFASNGKEYPFLLVGAFPKPPPDKYVRAEHHAEHGGLRVRKDASLPEA